MSTSLSGQKLKKFKQKDLLKEFDQMTEHMLELHPALHRAITSDSLQRLIAHQRDEIYDKMDLLSFYKVISPIYSAIRDGHTRVIAGYELYNDVLNARRVFPYEVWINNGRIYITDSELDEPELLPGTEIIKIQDKSVGEFLQTARQYFSYEQEATQMIAIQNNLSWAMALSLDYKDEVSLQVVNKDTTFVNVELAKFKKWRRKVRKKSRKMQRYLVSIENNEYEEIRDGLGYFKIHQFGSYNVKKYVNKVKEIFRQIEKDSISTLIIDLRGNLGGDPNYVEALIHYISQEPFCRLEMLYQNRKGITRALYQFVDRAAPTAEVKNASKLLYYGSEETFREPVELEHEYRGQIILVTDEVSYSAAATLAAVIKCHDMGIVVGQATGGTRIFQAYTHEQYHPKTRFRTSVATSLIFTACSGFEDQPGNFEGVIPHITLERSLEDVLDERDVEMEYILNYYDSGKLTELKNQAVY